MNTDYTYHIGSAGRPYNSSRYRSFTRTRGGSRSRGGQWDYMVRAVCIRCKKTLTRYELLNGLAFCFNCRRVLFPETIETHEPPGRRWPYERFNRYPW